MTISIVGSGNVAFTLCRLFYACGHNVVEITGRNEQAVTALAGICGAKANVCPSAIQPTMPAEIYLVCLSDEALNNLEKFDLGETGVWAHTAGAQPIEILADRTDHWGVLYPLQSLRKEKYPYSSIPFLVQGSDNTTQETLYQLAESTGFPVSRADNEQRLSLHLAAVFANNFTNHMLTISSTICEQHQLDSEMLIPLILETSTRIVDNKPAEMQTGPAIRGDEVTMRRHLQLLQSNPLWQELYRLISESIRKKY